MKNSSLRSAFGLLILLLAGMACVLPGQVAPPVPVMDPNAINTSVAGTLQASAAQTAAAQPVVTAPAAVMTGTSIEQAQDGTTRYTDYDAGFEIIFPVGWLALRPNSDEFNAALAGEGAANSMLHDQMTADQTDYEANFDRLYSYILRPDIEKNVILGSSKLTWDSEDTVTIDTVTMGKLVNELEGPGGIPGFRANVVQLREDTHVKMIEVGGGWNLNNGQGGTVPFYSTVLFFKPTANSLVRITFTYLQDYKAQISADVKSVIGSIKIIQP